jgi:outer membrane lipoprotein SlyB
MKKAFIGLVILTAFLAVSCASEGYGTQKGAAIGAIGGALAGQAIGHNTAGTLIGAAVGALAGAVAGNAVDQDSQQKRLERLEGQQASRPVYVAPAPVAQEAPPGQWVEVPGQWIGGRWVPAHRAWVPVNP